jgi:hypothetical protein
MDDAAQPRWWHRMDPVSTSGSLFELRGHPIGTSRKLLYKKGVGQWKFNTALGSGQVWAGCDSEPHAYRCSGPASQWAINNVLRASWLSGAVRQWAIDRACDLGRSCAHKTMYAAPWHGCSGNGRPHA